MLVSLQLSRAELWSVYHVLVERLTVTRPAVRTDPPPDEAFRALEKIEAGDSRFTPAELRATRSELRRYLVRHRESPSDQAAVQRAVARITDALAESRRGPVSPTLSRQRPPR